MTGERPQLSLEDHHRWWKETGAAELRQILYWRWDPIGVSDLFPEMRDEYDGYAGSLANALRDGAGDRDVEALLADGEKHMESSTGRGERREVARLLVRWYAASLRQWLRAR